ncbi:MAG: dihydroorotase [Cytophagales bacterium]|nr:dihydroorotase [Cytophagales bacterium]
MQKSILILNATLVNEGRAFSADVLVKDGFIERIGPGFAHLPAGVVIDAAGKHLLPGVIDDQVHFREPGLTYKADLHSESRAAVAGGVTSFMEMPNTVPNTLTQALLADKYALAARKALANYSFFMGASNDNLAEIVKTNPRDVCGIKVFMGSSTGNMLVDNEQTLRALFRESPMLIATHCEDEATVRANAEKYRRQYGEEAPAAIHPLVRNEAACLRSSSFAVALAKEYNTRLHILHISTADELSLFTNAVPLAEKRITAEVCVHHLWFDAGDYERLGNRIKCNPAIKDPRHKKALFEALLDDRLDIIATDHAPHTRDEKSHGYWQSHAGLPLVQHPLLLMLEFYHQGRIALPKVVEKMSHAPATLFNMEKRGYLREGYWADLVLVDLEGGTTVSRENIHYKCGWSPLEGTTFRSAVTHTVVSGHLAYTEGRFDESATGKRLLFNR